MKLRELFDLAVKLGIEADPRDRAEVEKVMAKAQKAYDKLDDEDKPFYDAERLRNPYSDTRLLLGDDDAEIKKLICGVDMEIGEVMLTSMLNAQGAGIDLIMAHHPEGLGLAGLGNLMHMQEQILADNGVLRSVAEQYMDERVREVDRSVGVGNLMRAVDAARLAGLKMICVHTPADNFATKFMTEYLAAEQPETLNDLCKCIRKLPEYAESTKQGVPPRIVTGSGHTSVGKVLVDFTGGTSGPKEFVRELREAGISTIVCMHATQGMIDVAKECKLSIVIAGHMASDSLGLNQILDEFEARGVEVVAASGLIRVKRK
ncbi:MAG: NGG1p interacting factor NIF3 [Bacillota bacterium]|nr:NGG1p interacting factor NIF3 [Bacillota bacterium]